MSLKGIPAALLRQAAAISGNEASRETLERQAAELEPLAEPAAGKAKRITAGQIAAEKEVQAGITKLLRRRGAEVWDTSQPRATKITAGLPDLVVFDPYCGLVFIEVKALGGKMSPEQKRFRELCELHRVSHIVGGEAEVRAFIRERSEERANTGREL